MNRQKGNSYGESPAEQKEQMISNKVNNDNVSQNRDSNNNKKGKKSDMNKEVVRTAEHPAEQKEQTTSIKRTNAEERKLIG